MTTFIATEYKTEEPQFSMIAYQFGLAAAKRREGYKGFGSAISHAFRELIGTYALLSDLEKEKIEIKIEGTPNWKPATIVISVSQDDARRSLEYATIKFLEELNLSIENNAHDAYLTPEIYSHSQQHFIAVQTPWAVIQMLNDFIYNHAGFSSLDDQNLNLSERFLNDHPSGDQAFTQLRDRTFIALPPITLASPHLANKYEDALEKMEKRNLVNVSPLYLEALLNQVTGHLTPDYPQFQIH
ncbi:MAG: hypothetical protein AUJ12_08660 [Alphaproteobacteria bacterium CG1_02_46_17]|nr:MAG: hypothetical protein AUJ12_08660 [Alphaproteobacteria bacterium CG1_02_46_17]